MRAAWLVAGVVVAVAWTAPVVAHEGPPGPVLEVFSLHVGLYARPVWALPGQPCQLCLVGTLLILDQTGLDPDEDPAQGFRPGEHVFQGELAYREANGNHVGSCAGGVVGPVVVAPEDGVLDTPVLVWRGHHAGIAVPAVPQLEVWGPGPVAPLRIPTVCSGSGFEGQDALEWPSGNLETVLVAVEGQVAVPGGGLVAMQDVDTYPAWPAGAVPMG